MWGVIGGSGLSSLSNLADIQRCPANTPWGDPSAALSLGKVDGCPTVFLPRHGEGHVFAPHEINYRANIWALRDAGVRRVIAVAAVGGIGDDLIPGSLMVPDQIIDYTYGREMTYYSQAGHGLRHIDFTEPYGLACRAACLAAAQGAGVEMRDGGVYAVTQGPRLESAAEVRRLERDGADVVGMTGMPEAALARELELDYACIAVVANRAAGKGGQGAKITIDDMRAVLDRAMVKVCAVIRALVKQNGD